MITVQQYFLPFGADDNLVEMPSKAQLLSVELPGSATRGWERGVVVHALVDLRNPLVTRRFTVSATGEPLGPHVGLAYLGTVRARNKTVHVFDTGVENPRGD